jgi:ferritin
MRQPLISDELVSVIVEQISHEKYNANLYLYIASFLNSKGLSNIAKHFEGQFVEEEEHARILYNLLVDMGIHFPFPEIEGCSMEFSSMENLATAYFDREVITTQSLNEIKQQAMMENAIVEEKIREMILLQQNEMAEATDFSDKTENLKEWWQVALWDIALGG